MKKTIYREFWLWQWREEEQWLNDMDAEGWQLVSVGFFRYVFERGEAGRYRYRLEMLEHFPSHPESLAYLDFMRQSGAEPIATLKNWVYFRRSADEGSFDIYSDLHSRIAHLERIVRFLTVIAALEGVCIAYELLAALMTGKLLPLAVSVPLLVFEFAVLLGRKKMKVLHDALVRERAIRE